MTGHEPFMLLRVRPHDDVRERFDRWFRSVHLEDVKRIPGISRVSGARTASGRTRLGIYSFASTESVQEALQSPQAAYARGTWEQWATHLDELSFEIFAPLFSMPIYRGTS